MKTEPKGAEDTPVPSHRRTGGKRDALALASARVPFRVKLAAVWIVILVLLALLFLVAEYDNTWMRENARFIIQGLPYTIALAVVAIMLAIVLAVVGALMRLSRNPITFGVAGFYTSFFRGTPLIVQMFLIYEALPRIAGNLADRASWLSWLEPISLLSAFQTGILALGLNYGAYMTEIFRAGIQSVGHGQSEAAEALGMTYRQRMRRVVLPQAVRVIIPPTGNEFIAMMKDTALVSFLGVTAQQAEIFRRAQLFGRQDFRPLEAYLIAAAMYWALTTIFSYFQGRLERRLSKGYVRAAVTQRRRWLTGAPAGAPAGGGTSVRAPDDEPDGPISGGPELPGQGH